MLARAAALLAGKGLQLQQARTFAAAASQKIKLPDAPVSLSGTCESLATLTWQLASKEGQLEKVQDELRQVAAAMEENPELARIAVDPFMLSSVKTNIIKSLLADSSATEITKRLFISLAEENALTATLKVSEAYDTLMLAHRKEVHCTIVTSEPLDKLERVELRKEAAKFVEPGFKLVMQEKTDKKLIGGFILKFDRHTCIYNTHTHTHIYNTQTHTHNH
ncbi:MAG: mitochondrial ATP synthase subunit 5 [Monoraphidium minutum]|nr:MAG: mitochondrial ATP synthase subunit 5 [Monoraphidium minutum]